MPDQSIPTIQQKGGLVGIGISSPTDKLTIGGEQTGLSINSATSGDPYVRWRLDGTVYSDAYVDRGTGNFIIGPSVNAGLILKTNGSEKVRVTNTGFVGINESAPGYRLQVTDSNQYVAGFINNVANQLATVTVQNSALSTAGVNTGAATFELVGKAGSSTHGRHAWIGAEGVASETFRTKLLFKIRGESNSGYTWSGASAAPTIVTMDGNGQVSFNQYTSSGSFTGTAAGVLAFDSSGNIITQSATLYPSGSGTTNTLTKWTGTNTLGNSIASESGSTLTIAGTSIITSAGTERYIGLLGYNSAYSFIRSNVGFNTSYNSMTFLVNFNSDTSTQGNTAVPSWIMDLGGNIPDNDSFNITRSPAGSFSFTRLFKVTNAGDGIFRSTITATSATANAGSPAAGLFNSGNDGGVVWKGAITAVHNADVTINTGASIGITFQPLASTGSSFYGAAKIAGVRPNATANNQDTDLVFWTRTGASNSTTDSEKMRITNGGLVGIGTTNPLAGLQVEKYGSKFDSDVQYNQPAGNVFLSVTGSVANQDNWFGIRGNYGSSSGSSNLLLQANYRDIGSQAGHYISSKATNLGNADFEIGKLVTLTSISTPPNKVPQLYIAGGGNVGIGTVSPNVTGFGGATALTIQASIQPVLELIGSTYNASGVFGGGVVQFRNSSTAVATLGVENLTGNQGNMVFYTNNGTSNTERMRITSGGLVGIGDVTTPYGSVEKLFVKGSSATVSTTQIYNATNFAGGSNYTAPHFLLTSGASAALNNVTRLALAVYDGSQVYFDAICTEAGGGKSDLAIYTRNTGTPTEKVRITATGNVGINTTSPICTLDLSDSGAVISGTATVNSNMKGLRVYNTTSATQNNAVGIWFSTGPHQAGIASFRATPATTWETTLAFYTHVDTTSNLNDATEKMRITGNGLVGIGTTTPGTALEVFSRAADADRTIPHNVLTITAEQGNAPYGFFGGSILFKNRSYVSGLVNSARIRSVIYDDGAPNNFGGGIWLETTPTPGGALTPSFVLNYQGRVGIGTTTPARALDVNGEIRTRTGTIDFSNDFNNQIYVLSNAMTIKTNGSDRVTIDSAGRITQSLSTGAAAFGNGINIITAPGTYSTGHGGILQFQNEDVITAGIRGVRDPGSWASSLLFYTHTSAVGNTFGTTFTEKMRITDSGNVGIGTTSPLDLLHINGSGIIKMRITGTVESQLRLDSTYGQISNVSGDLYFTIESASGSQIFRTGSSTERMRILSGGNIGIGTSNPSTKFVVYDDTQDRFNIRIQSTIANNNNKYMGIGFSGEEANTKGAIFFQSIGQSYSRGRMIFAINDVADQTNATPSNAVLTLANNGAATFVSSVTATSFFESSDSRIKTLLDNTINYTLVANVEARYYEKNGVQELGYFAQDFENILPSAVQKDDKDFLNLSYTQVHTAKIAALEARVKELESQLKNK